ncbi:MAG: hypothetical protein IKD31_05235 [Clostridia bacterium]|nr:hypothetical protein [Clostridia bacterium]
MKKIISLLLIFALVCGMLAFSGCDGEKIPSSTETLTLEAGSATEGTGGTFSPEDHPILKGGVDENFPEYAYMYSRQAIAAQTMQVYGDFVICGFQYYLLSDPDQKLHPIFFEGLPNLLAEENPEVTEWSGNLVSFYLDEELTRQNGGVPVIHYSVEAKFTPPDPIPRASVKKRFFFTFDVKSQRISFLPPAEGLKTEDGKVVSLSGMKEIRVWEGRIYFSATVDQEDYFVSMKNDGTDLVLISQAEDLSAAASDKEKKPCYFVTHSDHRVWMVRSGVLYSAAADFSDLKKEAEPDSNLQDCLSGVHDGYLYFFKETDRLELFGMRVPFAVYACVRKPLANLSAEETLIEGIDSGYVMAGGNILYSKTAELQLLNGVSSVIVCQKLYWYDVERGVENVFFTQKEGDLRRTRICFLSSRRAIVDFDGYAAAGMSGFGKERHERILYDLATGEKTTLRTFTGDTNVREYNLAYFLDYAEK